MQTIRRFEENCLELFSEGLLNGTVHTCIGQEACSVGVINALNKEIDIVFSNHRGHGHYIAFKDNIEGLISEIMGKETGICGGIGGSQHLCDYNYYTNAIQGGIVPVATGMAFAEKEKESSAIVAVFLGDGTLGQGTVYESFNIASKWNLPIMYIVENNQYAQTTPVELVHAGELSERAKSFGIESHAINASDVFLVYEKMCECVEFVRSASRPVFLFLETYRLSAHSKGDDLRDKNEIDKYAKKDPLKKIAGLIDSKILKEINTSIEQRLDKAVKAAIESPIKCFDEYLKEMINYGIYYK